MKPLPKDLVAKICYLLIILSIAYISFYFFTERVNECTSDPLKFAVNKIKNTTSSDSVYGTLTIITSKGRIVNHAFGDYLINSPNDNINSNISYNNIFP